MQWVNIFKLISTQVFQLTHIFTKTSLFCSNYDLYTKSAKLPNIDELWPYYQTLIDKYCPGVLEW